MALEMTEIRPDDVPQVGVIVYEAFKEIAERHNFEPAFNSLEIATLIVRILVQTEGYGTYLLKDGAQPVACNFGDERDEIVGVGPVAVAVDKQGHGYGRQVMEAMLKRAQDAGFRSVRLVQVAYNMQSFSLYHNLGFNVTDMLANVRGRPGDSEETVDHVREYTPADLDACDELHRDVVGVGRRHDIELMANFAPPIVVEREGGIAGYLTRFPGEETFVTHGAARDERALRDAIIGVARATTGPIHIMLPVTFAGTVRWAMGQGFRLMELDSYMVWGEYQQPIGAWVPSPFY